MKYTMVKKKVQKCLQYMTLQQLCNRIKKYGEQANDFCMHQTLGRYYDYLEMREELGYDMTNEVFIHPKNLKKKHDEMVKERNARKDELYIAKKMEQFPNIANRYEKLNKKYRYETEEWIIRPAKNASEIIMEGRNMHHCVGGDSYLSKHDRGESFILFLRKAESPEKAYCTIEIKGKKILQWYEANDKKKHKDIIEPLLEEYVEQIGKRKKKEAATESSQLSTAV